jgi:mono/diheme cytochrome c family protein
MSPSRYRNLSFVALLLAAACGDQDHGPDRPEVVAPSEAEIVQEEEPAEEPAKIAPDEVGLPCEVKEFLAKHCQGCHGAQAKNGTALLTLDNLLGTSKKDPDANVATRALVRMMDTAKPMPPAAKMERPSEAELEMFLAWFEADMPAGRCDE